MGGPLGVAKWLVIVGWTEAGMEVQACDCRPGVFLFAGKTRELYCQCSKPYLYSQFVFDVMTR